MSTRGRGTAQPQGITMDANKFQQLLQAVRTQQQPAQAPNFALTPGKANAAQFIDDSTATGIKLWQEATASLPNKFTAEGQGANQFCELLLEQAEKSGWNQQQADIVNIPVNGENVNLFTGYGRVSSTNIIHNSGNLMNQDRRA